MTAQPTTLQLLPSQASGHVPLSVLGSTTPRIYTPPLVTGPPGPCGCGCALTPETSFGFDVAEFAEDVLDHPYDPWQRWLVIHGGELLPDGRPRFRILLVLVSRQNGKTEVPVVLSLYWQFVKGVELILGTSTKVDYAKESWLKAVRLAEKSPGLSPLLPAKRTDWCRQTNGEQESTFDDCRYKIAASNAEGGRSLTVHRLILDELRQHHDYSAWGASVPAMSAVMDAQAWALSNAGDDRSIVLNDKRAAALQFIETGDGDSRLGLFEWSAPDGADPLDLEMLAMANPNLGRRIDPDALLGEAKTAVAQGGPALATFRTESMCQRVKLLNPAIDQDQWHTCTDPAPFTEKRRVAFCLDVAPNQQHATLAAAAVLPDGRVRVEIVKAWDGINCLQQLKNELPGLVIKNKPKALGWFPVGPAAALASSLKTRKVNWPPAGVKVEAISGEAAAVCMGFASEVSSLQVAHSADPLLDAHVGSAERLQQGDSWRFTRKGQGNVDALYAAAGAVHLARSLPESGSLRILTPKEANE